MKNDLTCGVVRDLLPGYLEDLLGEESREAVERHLADCPGCAARRESLGAPAGEEAAAREVDYLKQVKQVNRKRIVISVLATAAGLLGALLLKLFVIGTPFQPQSAAVTGTVQEGGEELVLELVSVGSGNAFHGWRVEIEDVIACVYARDVLVSPLFQDGSATVTVPLKGVYAVWLGGTSGQLVWQDGVMISPKCLELLDAAVPYCGDPTALGRIADILNAGERAGSYTVSMQTSKRPYTWTMEFTERIFDRQIAFMTSFSILCLALVDNLEEAYFVYPALPAPTLECPTARSGMTLEGLELALPALVSEYNEAHGTDWVPKASVKDYTRSPAEFQRLLLVLENFYGWAF